ncbi:MAG TPA: ABC transporter permease, partial [Chryseosolibacter sp.]|nr:ABC transporter permease [Chryseosolibacter sp.]
MLRNYLMMGWRHVRKDKTLSAISVFGLSVSISLCLLIVQYGVFELHYDQFNANAGQVYRVTTHSHKDNQPIYESALTSQWVGPAVKDKLPEIIESARLISTRFWFDCTLKYTDGDKSKIFNERNLYYADPELLSIFSFPLKEGDKSNALEEPFSAVLSSSAAKRYFGEDEAVGKVLHLKGSDDENDYIVTGIMADLPADSHMDADILLSIISLENNPYFDSFDAYTYVRVAQDADLERLGVKLEGFASTYFPARIPKETQVKLALQPIADIHLYSTLQDEIKPGGNATSVYFLLLAAFAILLIAWINHINLATSRSVSRAREVGIRKASGANRAQLVFQFLSESMIINGLSIALALVIVYLLSPLFHEVTGLSGSYVRIVELSSTPTGLFIAFIFCAGIFLSGFYPAKIISSHSPALVLKGKFYGESGGVTLRKVMVVFQFTCSIVLTIAVLTFNQQFRFMQSQDLGIDINKTIVLKAPTTFATSVNDSYLAHLANFKEQLQTLSIISSITTSSAIPGEKIGWTGMVRKKDDESGLNFVINVIDVDFIPAFKLRMLAGRNFRTSDFPSGKFGGKTEPVILNKTAAYQLGFTVVEDAVSETIYWGDNKCVVVGVIDDFHQQSLKEGLHPMLFTAYHGPLLSMKLGKAVNFGNLNQSVSTIEDAWNTFFPDNPFDYFFLDDFYAKQ